MKYAVIVAITANAAVCLFGEALASETCNGTGNSTYHNEGTVCHCPDGFKKVLSNLQPFHGLNQPTPPTNYECVRGAPVAVKPPVKSCSPTSIAELRVDSNILNTKKWCIYVNSVGCTHGVAFQYLSNGKPQRTDCVPPNKTHAEAACSAGSSDTTTLKETQAWVECP